jgi:hypothetical protein
MSAIRDVAAAANPLLAISKRQDEFLLVAADLYEKFDALAAFLDDAASDEAVQQAVATLAENAGKRKVREALDRLARNSPEATDDFAQRLARHEIGNPSGDKRYYSTDRSPRRVRRLHGDQKVPTADVIAPDGSIVGREDQTRY